MLAILQFVFSSFWVWAGSALLLTIAAQGVFGILSAVLAAVGRRG
jgi:hypothetical protein